MPKFEQADRLPFSYIEETANDPYSEISSWGRHWLMYMGEHFHLNQVGLMLAGRDGTNIWVAGWPEEGIVSPSSKIPELLPLQTRALTLGWLKIEAGLEPEVLDQIRSILPLMAGELQRQLDRNYLQQIEFAIAQLLSSNQNVQKTLSQILDIFSNALYTDVAMISSQFVSLERPDLFIIRGKDGPRAAVGEIHRARTSGGEFVFDPRRPIWIGDLKVLHNGLPLHLRFEQLGFRSYLAIPFTGQDKSKGVLEFLWRESRCRDIQWEGSLMRMARQIALYLDRSERFSELGYEYPDLLKKYSSVYESLTHILGLRDHETEAHTQRVKQLTMRLVEHLQMPSEYWSAIERGALLHDIGKLGIPDAILLKPGRLTDAEHRLMQLHVTYGYSILSTITNAWFTLDMVLYHHERWDGRGYPDGLHSEQIPLVARLFAVVDVYDALTSDRPYRAAWLHTQAIEYLKSEAGRQFDPQMVSAFLEVMGGGAGI